MCDRRLGPPRNGFTLVEMLITVAILGLAGALVIPSMSQTDALRIQAGVRQTVADITYVQGDAMAFQQRRAIWFGRVPQLNDDTGVWEFVEGDGYTVADVRGPALDLATDSMFDLSDPTRPMGVDFSEGRYGGAVLGNIDFNETDLLIFDELGGPVAELDGPDPGNGGAVEISNGDVTFEIAVAPFTGRVIVTRTEAGG
ncbi:MAG: prepilin-type N-terminal cleavage/methylation domain-containing protein [Planctomycetota bacterium]